MKKVLYHLLTVLIILIIIGISYLLSFLVPDYLGYNRIGEIALGFVLFICSGVAIMVLKLIYDLIYYNVKKTLKKK